MAPGPELAVMLSGIDMSTVTGTDAVEVLRARHRQLSHDQAQFLAAMVEVGLCDPAADPGQVARLAESPQYASDEIRAALAWTRRGAERELGFAENLVLRMPAVFAALDAGQIDRRKAWVFVEFCTELSAEHTEVMCQRLLPRAGQLTTGELAARLKKLAIALDPDWAARRYEAAVRERNVVGYLNEDGTATVTGYQLPTDQAAAACARIEDLAKAAKRAGHPGRVGQLRADLYLGLLDGRWQHLTREQIIADLLAQTADNEASSDTPGDHDDVSAGDGEPSGNGPAERDCSSYHDGPADHDGPAGDDHSAQDSCPADDGGQTSGDSAVAGSRARVGIELRVGLSTLLGRDDHPAEIPGWGAVTADLARVVATAQRGAQWCFAITDEAGQLTFAGITRHRPQVGGIPSLPCRGGMVELHIRESLLIELTADPAGCGEWAGVVADIARQNRRRAATSQDPTARFAGAALRRHVHLRDRSCIFMGCRCPARAADLDHTIDHAHHGATTEANQGPVCRHDHRIKHVGGWRLSQPEPGHFVWVSPLGRIYYTQPPPIIDDLPDPRPGPPYPPYAPQITADDLPILEQPPFQPDPPPPPDPVEPDNPPF